jgi:hypothetical protein
LLASHLNCRDEVAKVLSLKPEDLELSMGMSSDFEMAVSSRQHSLCWKVMIWSTQDGKGSKLFGRAMDKN